MSTVRAAVAADAGTFYQLMLEEARYHDALQHVHTNADALRRGLGSGRFAVLLAEVDGEAAGYLSYTVNHSIWLGTDYMAIDDVFVLEKFRGRKLGEALMLHARKVAQEAGYPRMRWEVQGYNEGAIRFYQRLGASMVTKGIFSWPVEPSGA